MVLGILDNFCVFKFAYSDCWHTWRNVFGGRPIRFDWEIWLFPKLANQRVEICGGKCVISTHLIMRPTYTDIPWDWLKVVLVSD